MEPCAWCVLQRLLTVLIAVLALIGAAGVARWRRGWRAGWAMSLAALAILGLIAAWYQQTVAAQALSCAWTWADRTLMASHLPDLWPAFFEPRANCAQASQERLLGLPWALWSGSGFVLTLALAGWVGLRTLGRRR
jgi:disulfide bond formation protein DsbB